MFSCTSRAIRRTCGCRKWSAERTLTRRIPQRFRPKSSCPNQVLRLSSLGEFWRPAFSAFVAAEFVQRRKRRGTCPNSRGPQAMDVEVCARLAAAAVSSQAMRWPVPSPRNRSSRFSWFRLRLSKVLRKRRFGLRLPCGDRGSSIAGGQCSSSNAFKIISCAVRARGTASRSSCPDGVSGGCRPDGPSSSPTARLL